MHKQVVSLPAFIIEVCENMREQHIHGQLMAQDRAEPPNVGMQKGDLDIHARVVEDIGKMPFHVVPQQQQLAIIARGFFAHLKLSDIKEAEGTFSEGRSVRRIGKPHKFFVIQPEFIKIGQNILSKQVHIAAANGRHSANTVGQCSNGGRAHV